MSLGTLPAIVAGADDFRSVAGLLDSVEIDGFAADFISWGFFRPTIWRNYSHTHSFYEVCLAYAGEGTFSAGDERHEVMAETVFLARPGDVHEIVSSHTNPLGIAFWGFTLTPGRSSIPSAPGWWSGLVEEAHSPVSTSLGSLPGLVAAMASEARHPRSGVAPRLKALGSALVIDTARAFTPEHCLEIVGPDPDRAPVVVGAMQRYLADNLDRAISVRDVAAAVHLSERHAERLFHDQTGAAIMATLRRLRLERSAQLLLGSAESVTEVARSCGYTEVRPFITAFRRQYGQPPRTFRANRGTLQMRGQNR